MAKTDRRSGLVVDIAFGATSVTPTAPTVAEVGALTRIEDGLLDGSPAIPRTGSAVDIFGLTDTKTARIAGRINIGMITGTGFREFDGTDVYYALFDDSAQPPTVQYLVICRAGFTAGTPTIGDEVDVYTVHVASRADTDPDGTDNQRFRFELTVIDEVLGVAIVA